MVGKIAGALGTTLLCGLGWELLPQLGIVNPVYFPAFSKVVATLVSSEFLSTMGAQVGATLRRSMLGFLLAAIFGILAGILLGRSRFARFSFSPLLEFLRPLPASAIIPVAILFLGLNDPMKIAVIAYGSCWPILIATTEGAQSIDPVLLDSTRLLRIRGLRRIGWLYLPWTAPFIVAGLRTSLAVALILAVTTEMLAGSDGMGYYILDMERAFQIPSMFAAILVLGCVGLALNGVFQLIQKRVVFWRADH